MGTSDNHPTLIVLVLGDSNVGKTSFVRTVCSDQILTTPPAITVGCHIAVKVYERRDRHQNPNLFFIQFHDIGGSVQHKLGRSSVFYDELDGIILVSDLTSRQSYENLKDWLLEVIRHRSRHKIPDEFNAELLRTFDIPLFLVHTKFDESKRDSLLNETKPISNQSSSSSALLPNYNRRSHLANLFNCDEIFVECYSKKKFSADNHNAMKLNSFFEKMIKTKTDEQYEQLQHFDWYNSENHFIH